MIKRYPHIATVDIETPGAGPFDPPTKETIEIKGRYEPAPANANLNYSAKYYCPLVENPDKLNGQKLNFRRRLIGISQVFNYQTHCEIWLD